MNKTGWRRWVWPLLSRKVQLSLGATLTTYLVAAGVDAGPVVTAILTVAAMVTTAVAAIFGIAIEDAAEKG